MSNLEDSSPNSNPDAVDITYLLRRYNFKSTSQTWRWLESIGYGKDSGHWLDKIVVLKGVSLPYEFIADIDEKAWTINQNKGQTEQ